MGADGLNGLSLGEAFRKHVIGDCEVAALGRRLMEVRVSYSTVFIEGQTPGPVVDFHWPLQATTEKIAYQFVSSPLVDFDQPSSEPSELETEVSRALADRIKSLVGCLARGEIISIGTFAATGVEGPIGGGQWTRSDLSIDVENSALCEIRNHRPVALWTGIVLRAGFENSQHRVTSSSSEATSVSEPAESVPRSTAEAGTKCNTWLQGIVGASPEIRTRTNESLWEEAKSKWPGLSKRGFERALAKATEKALAWSKGGRPKKTSAV